MSVSTVVGRKCQHLTVPGVGLEPTRPFGQWILNPSRLPIPPSGLDSTQKDYRLLEISRVLWSLLVLRELSGSGESGGEFAGEDRFGNFSHRLAASHCVCLHESKRVVLRQLVLVHQ